MNNLKIISTMIALSILFSGCISGATENLQTKETIEQSSEPISLRVWGAADDQDLLSKMIEGFEEEYKEQAQFDITMESVDIEDCKSMILENINVAPDVFTFADDQLLELAASGILEPLNSSENIQEKNMQGSVEAASTNGNIYAYPLTADNGYFMFYNKAYFKEENLATLDNILQIASNQNKKVTFDLGNSWYLYSFFGNTGLTMELNDDELTNYCDWNSTTKPIKGVDVGNSLLDIINNPGFLSGGDQVLTDGAANGTVIAGVSGVWLASALQEAWGDNFGATKLPTYKCAGQDIQMSSFAGYKLLGANAYSPNKEWSNKLAIWLSNYENQLLRFQQRGNGPSNKEAASSQEVNDAPQIKALIMQSEFATLQRVGAKYWEPTDAFGRKLIEGKLSPTNMQSELNTMVKGIEASLTE